MNANERAPKRLPDAFYRCENPDCAKQRVWRPHELRWFPGGAGPVGAARAAGFYCEGCYGQDSSESAWQSATTLAMELARGRGAACEWDGKANSVPLSVVGRLVAFPHGVTFAAVLDAPLVGTDGEESIWQIEVGKEWADTEFLPDDLVRVEGCVGANGECDPFLDADRVDLLRQGHTGKMREELLACSDAEERWNRAGHLADERYFAGNNNRIGDEG